MKVIRMALTLILLSALVAALGAAYQWWRYDHEAVVPAGVTAQFDVRKGVGGSAIAPELQSAGVAVEPWHLAVAWRLRGDSARVKAGRYELSGPVTLKALLDTLIAGQPDKERTVVLIEGWNFRQVREALANAPEMVNTIGTVSDAEVMRLLNAEESHPEGMFAPDTYAYRLGSSDLEVLARAYRLQRQRVEAAWQGRADGIVLRSPRELLILASIIEKESGRDEDRPMIASVFHNRLRIGMILQSDPTTIYGIGERFDGNLRRSDLRADTPYNTYVHRGLTPTPIAMPGRSSLEAAARPASSKAFYFVARGDGSTVFSNDLAGHNRAVNKYQRQSR